MHQSKLLCPKLSNDKRDTGDVAARPVETGDEAELDRVGSRGEDNRNSTSRGLGSQTGRSAGRGNDRDSSTNEVGRLRRQSLVPAFRPAILDRQVLAVYVAGFPQSLAKRGCVESIPLRRCAVEESDCRHCRLLRARRERPRRRAAEKLDQFSPLHASRATVWRSLSGWLAAHSGYHGGTGQVLGADLNRSESTCLLMTQGFSPL